LTHSVYYIVYQPRRRSNTIERRRCSNRIKTREPLKFAGVPQTPELILAVSGSSPYCRGHLEEILLFKKFFFRLSIHALIEKILECGPMPNVMVALPNTGGALCSTPQSLADADYLTAVQ